MATRSAIEYRRAELLKRLQERTESISAKLPGVEYPPAFPYVRQPAYRANDLLEQEVIFLDRVDEFLGKIDPAILAGGGNEDG